MVCTVEVLPLLQRYRTGLTPPVDDAVQVMFDAKVAPVQVVVSAALAVATLNESATTAPRRVAVNVLNFIQYIRNNAK